MQIDQDNVEQPWRHEHGSPPIPLIPRTDIDRRDRAFGWLVTAPGLGLLLAVVLFPVLWALWTSFHDFTLIAPNFDTPNFPNNYTAAVGDGDFRHSLWLTGFFVIAVVALEFVIGFAVALMLDKVERGKPIYYAILLVPAADEPGHRRPHLADVPAPAARHRELPAVDRRHPAGQLAGLDFGRHLDRRAGRHLAPGVVHDRAAARRPRGAAARTLRGGARRWRFGDRQSSGTSRCR